MSILTKEIEYLGFTIIYIRDGNNNEYYKIIRDGVRTNMCVISEKAAKTVIDTYLKSLKI